MSKKTALQIVLIIFFQSYSLSFAEYHVTPLHDVHWKITKGASFCQLEQEIPLYGIADFIQYSGDLLRFSIRENQYKSEIVKASLVVEASPWGHRAKVTKDYLVSLDVSGSRQRYSRLSVYGNTAEIMLDALVKGQYPTFSFVRADIAGISEETNVAVSSVDFLRKYQQFVDCRKGFLPSGIKQHLERSLFFKPASKSINSSILAQLKDTAKYLKEIDGAKIVIVSDTAIAGGRDKRWFLKRADSIVSQLKSLGVSADNIKVNSGLNTVFSESKTVQLNIFGPDSLKYIYYRKGNTRLTYTEKKRLDLLIDYAHKILPNSQLIVRSYTDSKGSRRSNLKVSQKRGDVIKQYLVSKGFDGSKVQVKAYGETRPAKSNRFATGRAQNRRAIIDFVG